MELWFPMVLIKGKPLKNVGKLEGKINPDELSGQSDLNLILPVHL